MLGSQIKMPTEGNDPAMTRRRHTRIGRYTIEGNLPRGEELEEHALARGFGIEVVGGQLKRRGGGGGSGGEEEGKTFEHHLVDSCCF